MIGKHKKIWAIALAGLLAVGVGASLGAANTVEKAKAAGEGSATCVISSTSTYYSDGYLTPDTGASGTSCTWTVTQFSITQLKNNSSNSIIYTYDEDRVYQYHSLTFTPVSGYQIDSVVATTTAASYATALSGGTYSGAKATVSSSVVTITPSVKTAAFSVTVSAQARVKTFVVNYASASSDPSLAIDKTSITLESIGTDDLITATYANLTGSLAWESDNTDVCTVDSGAVTSTGIGSTTVRAYDSGNTSTKAECTVTVIAGADYTADLGYIAADTTRFEAATGAADAILYSTAELGNSGLLWTATVTPLETCSASISNNNYSNNGSTQFGKSNYIVKTAVLRSDIYSTSNKNAISKVVVSAGGSAAGSTGTISVSIGETAMACSSSNSFSGNSLSEFAFTSDSPLCGHVVITLSNSSTSTSTNSGMKISLIKFFDVTKLTTDAGLAIDFAAKVEAADGCVKNSNLTEAYSGLSNTVKAIADEMTIYDYAVGDTGRANAKKVSFTVSDKMAQIISIAGSETNESFLNGDANNMTIVIIVISVLSVASLAAFFIIKKKSLA